MKKNDIKELRGLSVEELTKKEEELRGELFNLQMQRGTSQLENPKRMKNVKKDVARIRTIITEINTREAVSSPSSEG
ncbi:50S ribosomal protein L29 [Deltaproteobacteria bacterium Smac51]|nr:50S ribosomal protein L29 [Deltaproteobacteria bacterium Smac51]